MFDYNKDTRLVTERIVLCGNGRTLNSLNKLARIRRAAGSRSKRSSGSEDEPPLDSPCKAAPLRCGLTPLMNLGNGRFTYEGMFALSTRRTEEVFDNMSGYQAQQLRMRIPEQAYVDHGGRAGG